MRIGSTYSHYLYSLHFPYRIYPPLALLQHCESLASTKQIEHTASNCSRPAWASSCYSEQSAGSRRWRSSNNPRKVRFADTVEVIWVPSRATYARCGIKDEIWWSSAEFREFKEASLIAQSRSATATSKASTATSKASTGSTSSLSRDSEEGPRDTLQRQRSFDNFMQANQSQMETLYRKMIIASPPPKMGMGMS